MNPCALSTSDLSGLSCLSCPLARCLPVSSLQFDPVGGVPPLLLSLLVLPPLLLACSAGPCRRNGTRKAPIPATIRAMAPTLRFVDESISCFSHSPFSWGWARGERGEYMIQRFEQLERCQTLSSPLNCS